MKTKQLYIAISLALMLVGCGETKVNLGEMLFNDVSLSKDKTMSCATCHDLDEGFVDKRSTNLALGASLGDNLVSIGDRNAPTIGYAKFTPKFHFDDKDQTFIGGQFVDGRAEDLKAQAKGPFLNPVEMNMPDEAAVIARVKENPEYIYILKTLYGVDIFNNTVKAYDAVTDSIAEYEKSALFAPFNSKYDRAMRGEDSLSEKEIHGLTLFNGKAKCNNCHSSTKTKTAKGYIPSLFTDFTYDNLGVPVNSELREANGKGEYFVDNGLFGNKNVYDTKYKGVFKVSTLRNIAVTGPYMHNGVFKDLATVVHFYNTRDVNGAMNPETNQAWKPAEVEENKNKEELGNLKLTTKEEDELVAYLKTLTDEKFEYLIR